MLAGSIFHRTNLQGANFVDSDVSGAIFFGANVKETRFRSRALPPNTAQGFRVPFPLFECADLTGAKLDGSSLFVEISTDLGGRWIAFPSMSRAVADASANLSRVHGVFINAALESQFEEHAAERDVLRNLKYDIRETVRKLAHREDLDSKYFFYRGFLPALLKSRLTDRHFLRAQEDYWDGGSLQKSILDDISLPHAFKTMVEDLRKKFDRLYFFRPVESGYKGTCDEERPPAADQLVVIYMGIPPPPAPVPPPPPAPNSKQTGPEKKSRS